jgi:hypothetical protein
MIGKEDSNEEEVVDNILTIYNTLLHNLPGEKQNIKSVILKLSMGKAVKIGKEEKEEVKGKKKGKKKKVKVKKDEGEKVEMKESEKEEKKKVKEDPKTEEKKEEDKSEEIKKEENKESE